MKGIKSIHIEKIIDLFAGSFLSTKLYSLVIINMTKHSEYFSKYTIQTHNQTIRWRDPLEHLLYVAWVVNFQSLFAKPETKTFRKALEQLLAWKLCFPRDLIGLPMTICSDRHWCVLIGTLKCISLVDLVLIVFEFWFMY